MQFGVAEMEVDSFGLGERAECFIGNRRAFLIQACVGFGQKNQGLVGGDERDAVSTAGNFWYVRAGGKAFFQQTAFQQVSEKFDEPGWLGGDAGVRVVHPGGEVIVDLARVSVAEPTKCSVLLGSGENAGGGENFIEG